MIDLKTWKPAAMAALKAAFGERLLCLGLQGSYLRGEATSDSDIDLLVMLDQVTIDDLDAFHAAMRSLPDGERAVGFTCGRAELAAWPAYELYQFEHGTEVWLGDLHTLLPEYDEDDIRLGARVSVANLYHMVNHTYLTTRDLDETARADVLKSLLKAFFFSRRSSTPSEPESSLPPSGSCSRNSPMRTSGRCSAMPCRATPSCPSARPTSATMTSWARRSTRFSKHGAPAR